MYGLIKNFQRIDITCYNSEQYKFKYWYEWGVSGDPLKR